MAARASFPDLAKNITDSYTPMVETSKIIKKGETSPKLVEGMACPGGCVGGPGTLASPGTASRQVTRFAEAGVLKDNV